MFCRVPRNQGLRVGVGGMLKHFVGITRLDQVACVEDGDIIADPAGQVDVMRYEEHGESFLFLQLQEHVHDAFLRHYIQ